MIVLATSNSVRATKFVPVSREQVLACSYSATSHRGFKSLRLTDGPWSKTRTAAINASESKRSFAGSNGLKEKYWRESFDLLNQIRGKDDPETIQSLANLAEVITKQGRLVEAELLYIQAARSIEGQQPVGILSSGVFMQIARLLYGQGRTDAAVDALVKAAQYSIVADDPPYQAEIYSIVGMAAFHHLKHADAGVRCFDTAIKLTNFSIGIYDREFVSAKASNILARYFDAAMSAGLFPQAERIARRGLAISESGSSASLQSRLFFSRLLAEALLRQGKAHLAESVLSKALNENLEKAGDSASVEMIRSRSKLAKALFTQGGRGEEALKISRLALDQARSLQQVRLESPDPVFSSLGNPPTERESLLAATSAYVDAAWQTVNAGSTEAGLLADEALRAIQELNNSRGARAMSAAAARRSLGSGELAVLLRQLADLQIAGQANREAASDALVNVDRAGVEQGLTEFQVILEQNRAVRDRLKEIDPDFSRLIDPRTISIKKIRDSLRDDQAMIVFFRSIRDGYHTFLISRKGVEWSRAQGDGTGIESAIEKVRCGIDADACSKTRSSNNPNTRSFPFDDAYGLYAELFAPLEQKLRGINTVFIISDGPLATFPLQILPTRQARPGQYGENDLWLGDRLAIVSLPSVSAFAGRLHRAGTDRSSPGQRFVGYGAPDLVGEDSSGLEPERSLVVTRSYSGTIKIDPLALRALSPLPGTKAEILAAAHILKADDRSIHLGSRMTEGSFKTNKSVSEADLIIIATHGVLPGDLPNLVEPGLVFSPPATATEEDDGFLSASEISEMRLDASLIILSACNTARSSGEDLSVLATSFLHAGSGAVLGSHWRVSDLSTAALTREIVRAGQAGLTRAQAFQAGMKAVRTGSRADGSRLEDWESAWSSPREWGAFSLIANGDE